MSLSSTVGSGLPPGADALDDLIVKGRPSENVEDMRGGNSFNLLDPLLKSVVRGAAGSGKSLSQDLDQQRDFEAFAGAKSAIRRELQGVVPGISSTPTYRALAAADASKVASAPATTDSPLAADLGYNSINTSAFNSLDPPQPPPQPAPYASWRAYDRRYLDVEDPPDPMKLRFPTYRAAGGLDVARDMIVRRMYGADQ